ncbi:MAG: hypothetical protein Q7K42_05875, partial [Candidatus Diapherotrites archaeon]|nr:hypothetical protein [Candidatus Diapherotrites archaeon]
MKKLFFLLLLLFLFGICSEIFALNASSDAYNLSNGQSGQVGGNASGAGIDTNIISTAAAPSKASSETFQTTSVSYTNRAPEVSITSPSAGYSSTSTSLTIVYSGTDDDNIIVKYYVKLDASSWTNNGLNIGYTFSGLSVGSHTAYVIATDVGDTNSSQANIAFTITSPPSTSSSSIESREVGESEAGGFPISIFQKPLEILKEETIDRIEVFTISSDAVIPGMAVDEIPDQKFLEGKRVVSNSEVLVSRRTIGKTTKFGTLVIASDFNFSIDAKNVSPSDFNGLTLIEKVPKELAQSSKSIAFEGNPEIIEDDPLFSWIFDLEKDETKSFHYALKGVSDSSVLSDVNNFFATLTIPSLLVKTTPDFCSAIICDDGNPCTNDYCSKDSCLRSALDGPSCGENKFCAKGICTEKSEIKN